jgi:hypothetical protein
MINDAAANRTRNGRFAAAMIIARISGRQFCEKVPDLALRFDARNGAAFLNQASRFILVAFGFKYLVVGQLTPGNPGRT